MDTEEERTEAAAALQRLATCVRELMPRFVNLQLDGSGSPQMLALRDTFTAFPAPAEVLFIDGTHFPDKRTLKTVWTLVRLDMSSPRTTNVKFAGSVAAAEMARHSEMLEQHFGIRDFLRDGLSDLSLVSSWDDLSYIHLAPYDIRKEPEKYAKEFANWISMDMHFRELFLAEPDFSAKYRLPPDSLMPTEALLRLDFKTGEPSSHVLRQFSLRELQENVADIQLIPQVPESLREVIRRAKKLYVYGFFEYAFFTVAAHYAYAAMEAAMKTRWGAALSRRVKLTHRRNGVKEEVQLDRTGYASIEWYCETHDWRTHKLMVNGRQFPRTSTMVLNWLRDDGVITDYQKAMFEKAYLPLRNSHSHMEQCSTSMPDSGAIRRAVDQINILFDSALVSGT